MAAVRKPKTFEGETLEAVDAQVAKDLHKKYLRLAKKQALVKKELSDLENELKEMLGGFEHVTILGEQTFNFPWIATTSTDTAALDAFLQEHGTSILAFKTTNPYGTRRFSVAGAKNIQV